MNSPNFFKNGGEIRQSQYMAVERPTTFSQTLFTDEMVKILEDGDIVNGYGPGDIIDYDHELSTPVKNTGLEYIVYQGVTPIKTCDTFNGAVQYIQEKL